MSFVRTGLRIASGLPALAAMMMFAAPAVAQPAPIFAKPAPAPAPVQPPESAWRTPDPDNLLVIDTNKGRIIVELSPVAAPQSSARIKTLARQHFYDGQSFFRVIDAFMDQTGDPQNTGEGGSTLPAVPGEFTFRRDRATPFAPAGDSAGETPGFVGPLPVMSQPDMMMSMTADGRATAWGLFCSGVIGMARENAPDTANSQFFLMRHTYPSLDQKYAAFGRVIVGLDVVRAIKTGEPVEAPQDRMTRVRLASDLPASERPAVRVLDPASPAFQSLVAKARQAQGDEFSVCDVDVPVQAH